MPYLEAIVARLPIETDTALVLVPVAPAGDEDYAGFHRPALEQCGYRALRVWVGTGGDDAAGLTLALLGKAGLVWADVSELDHDVAVAIGAAQALGKPVVIVAREDRRRAGAAAGRA